MYAPYPCVVLILYVPVLCTRNLYSVLCPLYSVLYPRPLYSCTSCCVLCAVWSDRPHREPASPAELFTNPYMMPPLTMRPFKVPPVNVRTFGV
jgi:hypothetical protein